jgi:SulP family sulfate permease
MSKLTWDKECWRTIIHQGYMLAAIGTVESMLTMKIVDSNTGTLGWGNRQEFAVGFANVVAGFLGGMGGTAMIGLSTIVCDLFYQFFLIPPLRVSFPLVNSSLE